MHANANAAQGLRRFLIALSLICLGVAGAAQAAVTTYTADLSGANESSPNASTGTGFVQVDIDDIAHTMHLTVAFSGLMGATSAAHIHAATTLPGEGNAGVATTTPTFAGFPTGVTSGSYEATLDLTATASYNAAFITANGGSAAGAETALLLSIANGTAYFNLHSAVYPGGEIRGFLALGSVPAVDATWGGVKTLFR